MAGDGRTLTAVSYNVRAAIGPGPFPAAWWRHIRHDRMERIAAAIRGLDADVVSLQEVGLGTVDGVVFEQATELGRLTGLEARYGAAHHRPLVDPQDGRVVGAYLWGNALLSRWPIRTSRLHALPTAADDDLVEAVDSDHQLSGTRYADAPDGVRELRSLLACAVEVEGSTVQVLSTHLTYAGTGQRRAQAERILEVVDELDGPVILAGDLNASLGSAELGPLREGLLDAFAVTSVPLGDARRHSCGTEAIDHLRVRRLTPRACRVVREAGDASDHWPVVATFGFSAGAGSS